MNLQETLGGPLGQRLAWTLLHFLWQGLVISAGVAAAGWLLSPGRIRGRYAVALAGLVLMACCPLVTFGIVQDSAPKAAALAPSPDLPAAAPQPLGPVPMPAGDMAMGTPAGSPALAGEVAHEPPADPVPQRRRPSPAGRPGLPGTLPRSSPMRLPSGWPGLSRLPGGFWRACWACAVWPAADCP